MGQHGTLEKDDTVNGTSISGDYDYAKQFGSAHGEAPSSIAGSSKHLLGSTAGSDRDMSTTDLSAFGGPRMDRSLFADDMSFEQQFTDTEERFEVMAPAGKLGMVIDTPTGSVPIVHAIKEASVLADKVKVGDRLLSVDDEDTAGMTAMQVSKLISFKSNNPVRKLVFARSRNRANSLDTKENILQP